jgi:hypothetical protein
MSPHSQADSLQALLWPCFQFPPLRRFNGALPCTFFWAEGAWWRLVLIRMKALVWSLRFETQQAFGLLQKPFRSVEWAEGNVLPADAL